MPKQGLLNNVLNNFSAWCSFYDMKRENHVDADAYLRINKGLIYEFLIMKNIRGGAVVRAFESHAEGWMFESEPRQT